MKRLFAMLLLKEIPVMTNVIKWVTDPNMVARKRTIVTFLTTFAFGLKLSIPLFLFACGFATGFIQSVCSADFNAISNLLSGLATMIDAPATSAVAFLTGAWALISAYKKEVAKKK